MARIKPQALLLQSKKKKGPARIGIPTVFAAFSVVALLFLSAVILHRHRAKREQVQTNSQFELFQGKETFDFGQGQKLLKTPRYAVLNTTKGVISVQLSVQGALKTVEQFVKYSQNGYYNGLIFHRVIKHYMIQGGDPERAGAREDWTQVGHLNDELEASLKHEPFMFATSKAHSDSSGFELYITTTAIPHLDDKLLVFGRVVRGENVVQDIEEVDTDEHFRPKSAVAINDITFHDEL
ncbi:hypothetical protein GOP47_0008452 [Adiantum capillus-veneris]|uniref:Peptidyl-prolyl cis-trans isomerase n=1 Tax=Adiantum capillus-veneris TaxID=13818 RepID=A0A9D4ZJQ0_ADICA|nr:hypothetical protein GOP47_0008452 [Adiantum capillus-veneris]